MVLDVVDNAKPVPQCVDELPVDKVASARIHSWCRLAGFDEQTQTFTPRVLAEVVESGTIAGARDEIAHP
jgi:hypothetical protein